MVVLHGRAKANERFYTEVEEVEKNVTIIITNEFDPYDDCGRSNNVRHVDTSGLPQFTAKEETGIGLNESREVFRDFEKIGGFKFDGILGHFTWSKLICCFNAEYRWTFLRLRFLEGDAS